MNSKSGLDNKMYFCNFIIKRYIALQRKAYRNIKLAKGNYWNKFDRHITYVTLQNMYTLASVTCLFAKIKSTASRSSSSLNIRISSSRASPIRSRSLLSTTKMRPCNNKNNWNDVLVR